MAYRGRSNSNLIRALVTLAASLAVAVSFLVEYHDPAAHLDNYALFRGIMFIVFSNLIVDRISDVGEALRSDNEHDELKSVFESMPAMLLGSHNIVYFPTIEESRKHFVRLSESAQSIRNTVFRYGAHTAADPDDQGYIAWLQAKTEAIVRRRIQVKEIVSSHLAAHDIQRAFMNSMRGNGHYNFVELDDVAVPMMQMTIFEFASGGMDSKEVIFGWEFPESNQAVSFSTRNAKLVEYFERYFQRNYHVAELRHTRRS